MNELMTRKEYMEDSTNRFHEYYSQFVTEGTKRYVLSALSVEEIKAALDGGDEHLNEIGIPFNNMGIGGDWWWDFAPINTGLLKATGENNSKSTHTCVAKTAARILAS